MSGTVVDAVGEFDFVDGFNVSGGRRHSSVALGKQGVHPAAPALQDEKAPDQLPVLSRAAQPAVEKQAVAP